MAFRSGVVALLGSAVATLAPSAEAQEAADDSEVSSLGLDPALGLDPTTPQTSALPGGMTPAYGQAATNEGDWRFDYHGLFTAPLRVGFADREDPTEDQSDTVLHAPPQVPDDLETFSHTGVMPTPFAQLNLSYGNSIVTGTVSIVARQANVATGFFDPPSQLGVNDLFLRILPDIGDRLRLQINVGAFSNRYGSPGEYDEGRYGTPLIARINGVGEEVSGAFALGDVVLLVEQGIQGQSNKAPADLPYEGWNDFGRPTVGASFVHHLHAGVSYLGFATLGAHYLHAFSQDDRATGTLYPDGTITVLGTDLRLSMGRFGHFYFAAAHTDAEHAHTVGRIIEVLNTPGGYGLIDNYLGPDSDGNGSLLTFGAQYDLSVGRLVSYPVPFSGDGPDLFVSLFAMQTKVESDDPDPYYDGVTKRKYGLEATYSLLSWLAASLRFDQVAPHVDNARYSFSVISPRVIFRTDWQATDQVVLQYSHWDYGSLTTIRTGYPPAEDVTAIPDPDTLSLSASMWW